MAAAASAAPRRTRRITEAAVVVIASLLLPASWRGSSAFAFGFGATGIFMSRNRRAWASMPLSVASRSMLEAPKKPAMPVVWARTYSASSGSAIGPP